MTDPTHARRRQTWADALILPGQPNLQTSLVVELATYLGQPVVETSERCRTATADLARAWRDVAPSTPEEITAFYRQEDTYLYELTWWHALGNDDSALVQVEALEVTLAYHARTVLDFGGGIGSLGLLLARHGMDVTLAEISPALNAYTRWRFAQRGLAGRFLDAGSTPLPENAFDFIAGVDVFEHLLAPAMVLKALAAALRPGGTLFVHLPPAADTLRPMHLWHDPAVLLEHLAEAGLWLERASNSTLILRRGPAPRYALKSGLEPCATERGGVLLSTRPLVAISLNPPAFDLLSRLDRMPTAAELATATGLPLADVTSFLEGSVERYILSKEPAPPAEWPVVSIVLPARDRPEETRACVESLLALDYPSGRLEVVVVDDASARPLAQALVGLPARVLRRETNIGPSAARNLGASVAQGAVLAFIDNDCVADPHWLRALIPWLYDPAVDVVGGRVVSPPPDGAVDAFEAAQSPLDMGGAVSKVGPRAPVPYLLTCNMMMFRWTLQQLGGFDVAMPIGEDVDFVWRALSAGRGARYDPAGQIVHRHRTRLGALLRRRAFYASSEADLQRRHPESRRMIMVPSVGVMLLVALTLLPVTWPASVALITLAALFVGVELHIKLRQLQKTGVRMPALRVAAAIGRQHGAAIYHFGTNLTRYYSIPLLGISLLWSPLLLPVLTLLLVLPLTDHRRLHPRLGPTIFVGLYWLEQAAYQVGIWRGCLKWRTLRPLLPVLRLGR